jgi:hypothetical protein
MTQFPMNQNTPNGQTHTIMESPIWIGRLYTFQPTFWATWFAMFCLSGLLSDLPVYDNFWTLFITSLPLLISLIVDEKFTQQFLMPAWERSAQENHISIRGVPVPKIREWIEWHIRTRKIALMYIGSIHIMLTIFSNNEKYVFVMLVIFIIAIISSTIIKTWIGFKRFGFMSWYFSDITSFVSHDKSNS